MGNGESALARQGEWQIGRCRIEVGARELTGPSSPRLRRITPKAVSVLRLLAERPGQVVTRDELLARVWPDSAPTDDVLTQAITLLRKTFAVLDDSQPYIETIARSGYRLLVDVQIRDEPAGPENDVPAKAELENEPLQPVAAQRSDAATLEGQRLQRLQRRDWRRRRRRWIFFALCVLLLASLAVLGGVLLRQPPATAVLPGAVPSGLERPYRLLTASLEAESEPALSPDGTLVAYVRPRAEGGSEIVVQLVEPNARLESLDTPPVGAQDRQPVWSPDGRQIAFSRTLDDGRCAVLLATMGDVQPPVSLMRCDNTELLSFDFTVDGRSLLFGSSADTPGDGAITRLDLASRQWTVLDYPRAPGDLDHLPRLSPDGRWLVFVRNPQLGQLWRMPAEGGPLQPLGAGEPERIRGFAWLHDSRHLLVTRWVGMEMRLFQVDALSGQTGPGQDLGVDQAMMPSIARRVPLLTFVHMPLESRLMQVGNEGVQQLLPGSGQDLLPAVAPDGKRVLFVSDRSGVPALWLGQTGGEAAPIQIPGLQPVTHQPPAWSPDGSRALAVGVDDQGRRELYEIEPRTLGVVGLPLIGAAPLQAVYTDDSSRLLVIQLQSGRPQLRLYDRTRSPWHVLAEVPDVTQVRWDPAGRQVMFTRLDAAGLYSLPLDLKGEPRTVLAHAPLRRDYRAWSVDGRGGVWMLGRTPGCAASLLHLPPGSGHSQRRCLHPAVGPLASGFSGSLEQGPVMAAGRNDGGEIALLVLPGTASGQLSDGVKSLMGK